MESDTPLVTVEDVNKEPAQTTADCLTIPLILKKIFRHLSTWNLLQLSLVNKLWCYEARRLLRDRGTVTATVNRKGNCPDLVAFASDLQRMQEITKVHPSTGLTIHLGGLDCNNGDCRQQVSTSELNQACKDILDQLKLKHFALKFHCEWTKELRTCPGFLLMKKTLKKFGPVLEEFSIQLPSERWNIIQKTIERCCSTFSRLRSLKVDISSCSINDGYTNLIRSLVSHSPNLEVLHTSGRVNLRGNLLEGSSAVHVAGYPFSPFGNDIPESIIGQLRLTGLKLEYFDQDFNVNSSNRITTALLKASRTTLRSIHIDALFLAPFTTYGISLESVRTIEINFEHEKLEKTQPRVLRLVKCFDFTRIFPQLKAVKLNAFSHYNPMWNGRFYGVDDIVEQGDAAFREPLPDRAVNIKNLSVANLYKIKDSTAQFIAQMFPNVESLSIEGLEIPFGPIWEALHDLEVLDVHDVHEKSVIKNLDSVFSGIFPEEVAQLREQDEEYLRSVNIVPVMPSITCLKSLRNLNLIFGEAHVSMESVGDPTYLFSKVTALIAFQRCPGLVVTLITNETRRQLALSHLRPYVTVLPEDDHSFSP